MTFLTPCKNNFIPQQNKCVSCFSLIEGCLKCENNSNCEECYNNTGFQFEPNNGRCKAKQNINNNEVINLKYKRFDGYKKDFQIIYFNCHFVLS